jgi:hypothetical protein
LIDEDGKNGDEEDDDDDNYDEMMIMMSLFYITCAFVGKIGYCLMTAFIHLLSM